MAGGLAVEHGAESRDELLGVARQQAMRVDLEPAVQAIEVDRRRPLIERVAHPLRRPGAGRRADQQQRRGVEFGVGDQVAAQVSAPRQPGEDRLGLFVNHTIPRGSQSARLWC